MRQFRPRRKSELPRTALGWRKAGDLAHRAIVRHNVSPQVTAAAVCQVADQLSQNHYLPISWKDGTLKVACSTYENLIATRQREADLMQEINATLHEDAVQKILYSIT